jgi:hypothetical protein
MAITLEIMIVRYDRKRESGVDCIDICRKWSIGAGIGKYARGGPKLLDPGDEEEVPAGNLYSFDEVLG